MNASLIRGVTALATALLLVGCANPAASTAPDRSASSTPRAIPSATPSVALSPSPQATTSPSTTPFVATTAYVSSRYPYAMSVPASWAPIDLDANDQFFGDGEHLSVQYIPGLEVSGADLFSEAAANVRAAAPVEDARQIKVGSRDAQWLEAHLSVDGTPSFVIRVTIVDGSSAWDLVFTSPTGNEDRDRQRVAAILDSFETSNAPRNVWGLAVGDCFASLPLAADSKAGSSALFVGPVDGFSAVPCDRPHAGEVAGQLTKSTTDCDSVFKEYVGRKLAGSRLVLLTFAPIGSDVLPSGVTGLCVVADPSGSTSGTVKGSRR